MPPSNDRLLVIIATSDPAKAQTAAMYATNALKYKWMQDVRLILFGPAENLILEDEDFQDQVIQYRAQEQQPVACKFLSDRDGTSKRLDALGIQVEYVGEMISDLIKDGYKPMVW